MHLPRPPAVACLLLMTGLILSLLWGASGAWAFDVSHSYVQAQFLLPQLLPPPPAENSPAWRKQADAVIRAQKNLTAAEVAAMRDEQKVRPEMMGCALGADFTRDKLPKTFELLDHVLANVRDVSETDKKFWHTRRPYLTDKNIKLYVDPIDASLSYPSGHTTASRVMAEVLGLLMPDRLEALRQRANDIARHRIEAGVHYPVDIDGGRLLAMTIVGAMVSNDYFQDDLAAARKEIEGR